MKKLFLMSLSLLILCPTTFSIADEALPLKEEPYLSELQQKFGSLEGYNKVIFIERNKLEPLLSQPEQAGDTQTAHRIKVINRFFQDKWSITLHDDLSDLISIKMVTGMPVAFRTQAEEKVKYAIAEGKPIDLCVILPSNTRKSVDQKVDERLHFSKMKDTPEYQGKAYKKAPFTLKEMSLLYDIHEVFHCLDPYYMSQATLNSRDTLLHKAEAFAEVAAILYLNTFLSTEQLEYYKAARTISALMGGRYSSLLGLHHLSLTTDAPRGGAMYSFQRSMDLAMSQPKKEMTISEVMELAYDIVETTAMDDAGLFGIHSFQKEPKKIQDLTEHFINDKHEQIRERYQTVERVLDQYRKDITDSFNALFL